MSRRRYTENDVISIVQQLVHGRSLGDLSTKYGLSEAVSQSLSEILSQHRDSAFHSAAREAAALAAIGELSAALIRPASAVDLSSLVLDLAKRLTSSSIGFVGFIDPETGFLVSPTMTRDVWGECQIPDKDVIFHEFKGLWGWVLENGKPILSNDPSTDPRASGIPDGHIPVSRFLCAPALLDSRVVGEISIANSDRDYTEDDLAVVERLAALYALAIERRWTEDSLHKVRDELELRVAYRTRDLRDANEQLEREIACRVDAEKALRESNHRYKRITESITDYVYTVRVEDGIPVETIHQPTCVGITGYTLEDFSSAPYLWLDMIPQEDRPFVEKQINRLFLEGIADPVEHRIRRKDGTLCWVRSSLVPHFAHDGTLVSYDGLLHDVTEQREARKALQHREHILAAVAEAAQRFLRGSSWEEEAPAILERLGRASAADSAYIFENSVTQDGEPGVSVRHLWQNPEIPNHTDPALLTSIPYRSAGLSRWEVSFRAGESISGEVKDLPENEQNHAAISNTRALAALPIFVGEVWWGFLGFKRGQSFSSIELEALKVAAVTLGAAMHNEQGEKVLRESEERFRSLFEKAPVGYQSLDADGRVVQVNDAWLESLGYRREDVIGRWFGDFLVPDSVRRFLQGFEDFKATGLLQGAELELTHANGHTVAAFFEGRAEYDRDGRFKQTHCIVYDVTERKRLEQRVLHAKKMESLGKMAGGIAHDFNNLLMVILGNANLAKGDLSDDSPALESIEEIEVAARRAADLSNQMLAYSGRGRLVAEPTDLSLIVEQVLPGLTASVPEQLLVATKLDLELPMILGDPGQLRRLVTSLVTNAIESISKGAGRVDVRTSACTLSLEDIESASLGHEIGPGEYVLLEITDSGCGMDRDTLEKVFDPFFSTKFTGRGLGVPASFGIARGHGGTMAITSQLGQGTTVRVFFPCGVTVGGRLESPEAPSLEYTGKVLLVDDEPGVLAVGKRMLQKLGFEVMSAASGTEAIAIFRAAPDTFCSVILDLTMPDMDGEQVLRRICQIRKETPVLLSSGYGEQEVIERLPLQAGATFIQKPYQSDRLAAALKRLLSGQGQASSSSLRR